MAILLNYHGCDNKIWQTRLQSLLPDLPINIFPDIADITAIRYAILWDHPKGDLCRYPNLRAIFSLGAGLDGFLEDPQLPNVPLVPIHDPSAMHDMAMHALHWGVHFQRGYYRYYTLQQQQIWQALPYKPTRDFKIGILGLGRIASHIAKTFIEAGYPVQAWVRSFKTGQAIHKEIQQFYPLANTASKADPQLKKFLQDLDLLINCLPLTPLTQNFINADFLAIIPKNCFLLNVSRGKIIDEAALIATLQSGHLAGVALDVTQTEPLPETSPLWQQENCFITPHISGNIDLITASEILAENITRLEQGKLPRQIFDRVQEQLIFHD